MSVVVKVGSNSVLVKGSCAVISAKHYCILGSKTGTKTTYCFQLPCIPTFINLLLLHMT